MSNLEKAEGITRVMIRRDPKSEGGGVFALFVDVIESPDGHMVGCFTPNDGHSAADYEGCIRRSEPTRFRDADVQALLTELRRAGYRNLRVMQRGAAAVRQARREFLRQPRG